MKSIFKLIKKIILTILVIGLITAGVDYFRMTHGSIPVFNRRQYNTKTRVQTFQGIFYTASRKIFASPAEDLIDSSHINFRLFSVFSLNIPNFSHEDSFEFTVETKETSNCMDSSKLYYANLDIKVYTYCLEDIEIQKQGKKESLLSYLEKDTLILEDIDAHLGYEGFLDDGTTMKFSSTDDLFTNQGLALYQCNQENINDIYIGPKTMTFQEDFCTYKEDDFYFLYEISYETPSDLAAVVDEEGNIIPEVFYEDETYRYEFELPKSGYVFITTPAVRGREETKVDLRTILTNQVLTIEDLEKKGLVFQKIDKAKEAEELLQKQQEAEQTQNTNPEDGKEE